MNDSDVIKVVVDYIYPYITVQDVDHTREISGYMGELWTTIEETLNFTSRYLIASFKEGKDALIKGRVDVMLIPVVVTTSDVDDVDFSIPVAKTWYEMYIKRSGDGATSESYLETWSTSLWFAFGFTIFELSLILWLMTVIRKSFGLHENEDENKPVDSFLSHWHNAPEQETHTISLDKDSIPFSSCFLIVLGTITSTGFNINTNITSLRIIILVIIFFGLLMLNSYSAVLVSRLAVDRADIPFPTLESVSDRKTHSLCVRESSYAYDLFKQNETDTELLPVWRPIVNQPPCANMTTVQDIANALCQDHTVILETPHIIASISETKTCIINRMPGRYATAYTSLLMRKNFKYKRQINELLQKLLTWGIIDHLQVKWLFKRVPHAINLSSTKQVTMDHIKGVLHVYGASVLVSVLVLLAEKLMHWKKSRTLITLDYVN